MKTAHKTLLFMLYTAVHITTHAQENLVPNSSFENMVSCPNNQDYAITSAAGWFSAANSPDYFNPCAENEPAYHMSVPNNPFGYQQPFNGIAYAGLITYLNIISDFREAMSTQLTQPLVVGTRYYVSAYISRAFNPEIHGSGGAGVIGATNNFGFRFSTNPHIAIDVQSPVPIDNFSHIHSTTVVIDTTNWTWIGGSFIADSAYEYIMLGNFYDDAHTTVMGIPSTSVMKEAYYYVDEVYVSTDSTQWVSGIARTTNNTTDILVFPNPAINTLNINNAQHYASFSLLNTLGQKVKEDRLIEGINSIDISTYERGVYFLIINSSVTKILFIN